MVITGFFTGVLSPVLPLIYTNEETIVDIASKIFPLVSLFAVFDGVQGVSSGILRGVGHQTIGAASNLIAYYLIGLPVGVFLTFYVKINLFGLWIGLTGGLATIATTLLFYILYRIDWNKEAIKANERSSKKLPGLSEPNEDLVEDIVDQVNQELEQQPRSKTEQE